MSCFSFWNSRGTWDRTVNVTSIRPSSNQIKGKPRHCCLCGVREITVVIVTSLLSCCPPLTVLFAPLYSSLLSRFFCYSLETWSVCVCVCDRVVLFDIKSDPHFLWFSPNFIGIAIFKVAGYFLDGIFGSRAYSCVRVVYVVRFYRQVQIK